MSSMDAERMRRRNSAYKNATFRNKKYVDQLNQDFPDQQELVTAWEFDCVDLQTFYAHYRIASNYEKAMILAHGFIHITPDDMLDCISKLWMHEELHADIFRLIAYGDYSALQVCDRITQLLKYMEDTDEHSQSEPNPIYEFLADVKKQIRAILKDLYK